MIPSLMKGGAERIALDIVTELQKRSDVVVKIVVLHNTNDYINVYPMVSPVYISAYVKPSVFKKWDIHISDLQQFVDDYQPDIIHTHLFEAEFVTRMIRYDKCKWFYHVHDNTRQYRRFLLSTLFNKRRLTEWYERYNLFKRYEKYGKPHFLTISTDTYKYIKNNVRGCPVLYLPNAIDFHAFDFNRNYDKEKELILINVGSMIDRKNQVFLVDVAKELKGRGLKFRLQLLGDGVNYNKVRNYISDQGLQDCIEMLGNVDDVAKRLQAADIYVHSALSEGLPLCLLEAMSASLPIVSFDVDGCRDVVIDDETGYLSMQNASMFADKIMTIWNDKNKYKSMSLRAKKKGALHDIKVYVDKLLNMYE